MPFRRKRRGRRRRRPRFRKRRRRTRRTRNKQISTVRRMPLLLPDQLFVKLPYAQELLFNNTGTEFYSWNTNSMFKPSRTTAGHQPLGFDQWMAFYTSYKVHAIKVTATLFNNALDAVDAICLFTPSTTIEGSSSTTRWRELPYSTSYLIPALGSGSTVRRYSRFMSIKKIQGETLVSQDYQGTSGLSPTKKSFFMIFVNNSQAAGGIDLSFEINVKMTLYGVLSQRVNLTQS